MTEEATHWDDSQCWFCKARPAAEESKHEVDLYRVLRRKSTYIVFGMRYKQEYEKTKAWVPRCPHCQTIHDRVGYIFLFIWFALGIWGSIWMITDFREESDLSFFETGVGIVIMFFMCAILAGFARMLTNAFWKSEDESENHPRVQALISQGWTVGDTPPRKWSGAD